VRGKSCRDRGPSITKASLGGCTQYKLSDSQILSLVPASAIGKGFTVTITESCAVPPASSVTVTVYSVVTNGLTLGSELNGLLILPSNGTEVHS